MKVLILAAILTLAVAVPLDTEWIMWKRVSLLFSNKTITLSVICTFFIYFFNLYRSMEECTKIL